MDILDVDGSAPELLDLTRYPLDRPESSVFKSLLGEARKVFAAGGSARFEGFLSPEGLAQLCREASALIPEAHFVEKRANPYHQAAPEGLSSEELPPDHPYRIESATRRRGVAYHQMGGTALEALYRWPPLRHFVAEVTDKDELFLHEDPSNALVLQVYQPGDKLAWHFDRARFSTTLHLQAAAAGGHFESVAGLRRDDAESYSEVSKVLKGDRARVRQAVSKPGSFTIFNGNHTLHRVTEVAGNRPRLSLVLSYDETPGQKLDPETRRLFFGPTAPMDD